jgi:hypothetical protein
VVLLRGTHLISHDAKTEIQKSNWAEKGQGLATCEGLAEVNKAIEAEIVELKG